MPARKAQNSGHPVRLLSLADLRLVGRLRKICMALPEANERISHGEPTWFAGKGKVFASSTGTTTTRRICPFGFRNHRAHNPR